MLTKLIFHSWVWECPHSPPPPITTTTTLGLFKASFTVLPEPQWVDVEREGIADTGVVCQTKKEKEKKKAENYDENRSLFLSQGSNAHISSSSRPPSRVPCPQFSASPPPQNVVQPPAFLETSVVPLLLCTGLNFFFLLSFLALTSNHLTRNEWMNVWKVTVCNV